MHDGYPWEFLLLLAVFTLIASPFLIWAAKREARARWMRIKMNKDKQHRQTVKAIEEAARKLGTTNPTEAKEATGDLKVFGDPGAWECIAKASSESQRWMKSTKRMKVDGGWLYQVTTEHHGSDGRVSACAEALTFVPDVVKSIDDLIKERDGWKRRAASHGCDVDKGDPECG